MATHWTTKAITATETVAWMIKLNAWWWLFTIIGLGVFGFGPAMAAGAAMVRRRSRGDQVRLADYARNYRQEFVRANLAISPAFLLLAVLGGNLLWYASGPAVHPTAQVATVTACVFLGTACCFLGPLYAFYDLPRSRYPLQAIRITLARPLWSVLMLLITAAIIFAASKIIILIPLLAVGAWLHTSSWLGIRFFTENEDRLAASSDGAITDDEELLTLPTEPVRMH